MSTFLTIVYLGGLVAIGAVAPQFIGDRPALMVAGVWVGLPLIYLWAAPAEGGRE